MTWIWQKSATPNDAVNLSPATGSEAVFYLKEALKQAGWVVKSSSDGTTYNSTGDQITVATSGAGGMANNSAWFRIQSPAGASSIEFTFQRGTTNTTWRMKLSHSSMFTGGSPGATQTPSATDERIIAGGGTDAAPTFFTWLATDNNYKVHIGTDNAAPYAWYMVALPNGGGSPRRAWYVPLLSGGSPSADVAQYVVEMNTGSMTFASLSNATANTGCFGQGFYKKGLSGEAFKPFRLFAYYSSGGGSYLNQNVANPYDGNDVLLPCPIGRLNADSEAGWKGWAPTSMVALQTAQRADGDYVDVSGARYAIFDDIAFIWPSSVIPSL